ncbi:hypothetical protein TVAG_171950 [Trichomonas vaginalis G3]|uniref:Uncharacterized protein n=1 Tax=Trichomonas vaginalis (strain ATCC PRA-98 / G3) TaxID=412133 RepID=A2DEU6_TRIV3|nr:hypothetical protein TVAGG3_0530450 [Trichomonas vaginalis G3]EAY20938.1 hypothetical protein TVAG_171950 [Trichomonas vaginalis G3]KAI5519097.1 hypothetical protein TVAGG3_0530450 [Trichomonas vaginalis G3]|eukprot:XP_001581924.1 hypothetical protein [Trichomonas vaginalis G3]
MSNFTRFSVSRKPRADPINVKYAPTFIEQSSEAAKYVSYEISIQESFSYEVPGSPNSASEDDVITVASGSENDVDIIE